MKLRRETFLGVSSVIVLSSMDKTPGVILKMDNRTRYRFPVSYRVQKIAPTHAWRKGYNP
jgi:hypothetical protein